ncbi:hypothetical protein B0H10DRAFT_573836 [Mycena sp. CBHHK59/15]|nr:hypothetical protein B0H10DRAFT_573836 [Mycena sp. CBHHK59/15]
MQPHPLIGHFHRIALDLYPGVEPTNGHFSFICIHKMVSSLNDCLAKANSVKVALNSQSIRWPTSTKDIMPFGGEITTQMYLRWAHYTEDIAFTTFDILGHLIKICGSLIIGDMVANAELGDVFVSTGWRMCVDATDALTNRDDDVEYLRVGAEFCQRATFAASFLESATSVAPQIFAELTAHREAKVVQLLSLVLQVRDAPTIVLDPELEEQFKWFDGTIFSSLARQILADNSDLQLRYCTERSSPLNGPSKTRWI